MARSLQRDSMAVLDGGTEITGMRVTGVRVTGVRAPVRAAGIHLRIMGL